MEGSAGVGRRRETGRRDPDGWILLGALNFVARCRCGWVLRCFHSSHDFDSDGRAHKIEGGRANRQLRPRSRHLTRKRGRGWNEPSLRHV
jgi:hypothetical protein